jgi:hypothetical protein
MIQHKPTLPSFVYGYWRPWDEGANRYTSYLDYRRDTTLVKYGADTVGKYINQASKEQVLAINKLGQAIGRGMDVLSSQMSDINESIVFLNRNIDVQIEQQKLSNLILQNIAEILRVPDSEKERQHCIELGIKFFINASKDSDLYQDALEELLKAESLMKQDYFVLHRIGCIYLYVDKFINLDLALDYFLRAAKYASVESDANAAHLVNVLTNNFNTVNTELDDSETQIGLLAADSYEKAAFTAYIMGNFPDAVKYQLKALKFDDIPKNRFVLAKYQIRNDEVSDGISNLSKCIEQEPVLAIAAFKEIDLINEPEVIQLIAEKNQKIDTKISDLILKWNSIDTKEAGNVIKELSELSEKSYEVKISTFLSLENKANDLINEERSVELEIDSYIKVIKNASFCTLDKNQIEQIVEELINAKELPVDQMMVVFERVKEQVENDKIKIGAHYAGGIIFYLDETGKHGLICADKDFGKAVWGGEGQIGADGDGIADGSGIQNTQKIVEKASWFKVFFSTKPAPTAARLCLESEYSGYSDWYLPTCKEILILNENLKRSDLFWSSTEVTDGVIWTAREQGGDAWKWYKDKTIYGHHGYAVQGKEVKVISKNKTCNVIGIRSF